MSCSQPKSLIIAYVLWLNFLHPTGDLESYIGKEKQSHRIEKTRIYKGGVDAGNVRMSCKVRDSVVIPE